MLMRMNLSRLILRSLAHYWKIHLGLFAGTALAAAVVCGSLVLGDSVTASLGNMADARLGKIKSALTGGDRFFTEELASGLGEGTHVPVILLRATASAGGGKTRVNKIQVIGVPQSFGLLSNKAAPLAVAEGTCVLGEALARRLGAAAGDTIVIRLEKPGFLPKDAPLSGSTDNDLAIRKTVAKVLDDDRLGGFKLGADQLPALNAFVSLSELQATLGQPGRANLILSTGIDQQRLASAWTPADLALSSRRIEDAALEIRTDRVFLDPAVEEALIDLETTGGAKTVFTYLINAISSPGKPGATPNSMATATDGIVPDSPPGSRLPPAAIVQWLAEDLNLSIGDTLCLRYLVPGAGQRELLEKTADFSISRILPMNAPEVNASWTPAFPGISEVDNCRDWDPGFDIDLEAIRAKDQAYWDSYRGTPKVFLRPEDGVRLWRNRFGKATAVRLPQPPDDFAGELRKRISPAELGIALLPLRAEADAAVHDALPLGTYFLYFGWFILVAALTLAALLFLFSLESRAHQLGLQKAIGIPEKTARSAVLGEAALVALAGSLAGIGLGVGYARACLWGLANLWQGATGAIPYVFHLEPLRALGGALAAMIAAFLVVSLAGRRIFRRSPQQLLSGPDAPPPPSGTGLAGNTRTARVPAALAVGILSIISSVAALAASRNLSGQALMGSFFASGALLLITGISGLSLVLRRLDRPGNRAPLSIAQVGIRNTVRRPGRSLAVAGMIASAVFMVASVNAFRLDARSDADERSSGTGGFALIGESSLPVYDDPGSAAGRKALGFDPGELDNVAIVPLRTLPGEDASCLNLNRAQRPAVLGINPSDLAQRQAFTFAGGTDTWRSLEGLTDAGAVPAIVDQNTATYAMAKKIGDCLFYTDEKGETFQIEIVATLASSILQGRVIISAANFTQRFPSAAGYRTFLVDVDHSATDPATIAALLTRQLSSRGLSLQPAVDRLAEFHAVQNSYLSIFTALGGLGVAIGTLGLGAVVARNLLERRGELGLLQALGLPSRQIRWLVISENLALLVFGVALGLVTATLAIWPQVTNPGSEVNLTGICLFAGAALLLGLVSIAAASVRLPTFQTGSQVE